MGTLHSVRLHQLLSADAQLAWMLEALDDLHTAASEGMLQSVTSLSKAELLALLRDLAYTVEQTMEEIDLSTHEDAPMLRRVK